ncbi:DNA mismatch repair protein MutS2 [Arachidicoccus rhizosphaerae]|uniref:DNA mismatch repair protein MutS2 n=1 Tax=Arachidicoccus rhizosphaerae TaxID=551991 RepID=A0A1H4C3L6_9BACT|nr:MutS2/Smr-associated SH3 domain-containing protein [Arachidicoccus rhizosphaerae]SEA54969.1 DNA mismatch repair protein MutS2 [Arachidicoccus rhizosphaerae]
MKVYPDNAFIQLEFDKVKTLLEEHCVTSFAKNRVAHMRLHTKLDHLLMELRQVHEYKLIIEQALYFPSDQAGDLKKEIRLLGISGSMLTGEQWIQVRRLLLATENIFRWLNNQRREAFPNMTLVVKDTYYEKAVAAMIDEVIDETGQVKDSASVDLARIRHSLYKKRQELRRTFEKVVARLNKAGYTADISESFSNGRRVIAILSEYKRQIKGVFHGESDSRRTTFMEPEETTELNNQVYELENEELKEIQKILRSLTASLSVYAPLLETYYRIIGLYDFIRAKALLAIDMQASLPVVTDKTQMRLIHGYHPLLLLYNKKSQKKTIPVDLTFDDKNRILIISGPNAGGKTVTMKTVGLLQIMLQAGLLVPVHPDSQMGIFKQLFIHMGDTQSIEFELSTYSSHLLHMKHFIENANGRTLFFIDELGGGSDPNLGGAFAEVILEQLAKKHAMGIVTTHYLNLKVMAGKTAGIFNGAMAFDESRLQPLYQLLVGKPGSSYTFSIAERIGLPQALIARARTLVDENQFKLDQLLNSTEQGLQELDKEKRKLHKLIRENDKLKAEMERVLDKETHRQQVELLKHQNKLSEEKLQYLKDTERKLRQLMISWRKAEQKDAVIKEFAAILFPKNEKVVTGKMARKLKSTYDELDAPIEVGMQVKSKRNHQVGEVIEIRGKRAVVKIGVLPMQVELSDLVAVKEKPKDPGEK